MDEARQGHDARRKQQGDPAESSYRLVSALFLRLLAIIYFVFMGAVFEKSGLAERLLTTDNPDADHDQALFARLGIVREALDLEADRQTCGGSGH